MNDDLDLYQDFLWQAPGLDEYASGSVREHKFEKGVLGRPQAGLGFRPVNVKARSRRHVHLKVNRIF
jgi:hypothetical protein